MAKGAMQSDRISHSTKRRLVEALDSNDFLSKWRFIDTVEGSCHQHPICVISVLRFASPNDQLWEERFMSVVSVSISIPRAKERVWTLAPAS